MLIFKQCKAVWIVNSENSVNSVNHVNSVSTAYWAAYSALLHSSLMAFFACVNDEHSSLIWVSLLLSDEKFSVLKIKVLTDGGRHIFTNWANLNWDMRPPAFRIRLLSLNFWISTDFSWNTNITPDQPNLEAYLGKGIFSQKVMSETKIHVCVLLSFVRQFEWWVGREYNGFWLVRAR